MFCFYLFLGWVVSGLDLLLADMFGCSFSVIIIKIIIISCVGSIIVVGFVIIVTIGYLGVYDFDCYSWDNIFLKLN